MFESTLSDDGQCLTLTDHDTGNRARFHAVWLRDNAWDEATRAPSNGQRLITLSDIPADLAITGVAVNRAGIEVTLCATHILVLAQGVRYGEAPS